MGSRVPSPGLGPIPDGFPPAAAAAERYLLAVLIRREQQRERFGSASCLLLAVETAPDILGWVSPQGAEIQASNHLMFPGTGGAGRVINNSLSWWELQQLLPCK